MRRDGVQGEDQVGVGQLVMVVDDEPMVLVVLDRILRGDGHNVVLARGEDQMEGFLGNPDLAVVLLDLFMGRQNGVEVLDRIKRERPDVEVVVVTGHGSIDSAVRCMRRGAYDYLEKPFRDSGRISETVRAALERRARILCAEATQVARSVDHRARNDSSRAEASVPLSLEAYEGLALERALQESGGDARLAAARLGIGRSTFYRKAAKLGIALRRLEDDEEADTRPGSGVGRAPSIS